MGLRGRTATQAGQRDNARSATEQDKSFITVLAAKDDWGIERPVWLVIDESFTDVERCGEGVIESACELSFIHYRLLRVTCLRACGNSLAVFGLTFSGRRVSASQRNSYCQRRL